MAKTAELCIYTPTNCVWGWGVVGTFILFSHLSFYYVLILGRGGGYRGGEYLKSTAYWHFLCVFILLLFLAHLSQRLTDDLIVRLASVVVVCSLSTFSNIFFSETTGPIEVNFIWSIHGMGERPRWLTCPYKVKTLKTSSSPEPVGQLSWNLVCSIGDSSRS